MTGWPYRKRPDGWTPKPKTYPKRSYRPWTDEEVRAIRELAPAHTFAQVAVILGRTERSIIWKAGKERIAFRKHGEANHSTKHSAETVKRIWELRQQGWGQRRIAREVGMDNKHVYLVLNYGSRFREMMALDAQMGDD